MVLVKLFLNQKWTLINYLKLVHNVYFLELIEIAFLDGVLWFI